MPNAHLDILERHYTLSELSKAWHVSRTVLRDWFIAEAGVIRYGSLQLRKGRKRTHCSLRIPQSIAVAVYKRRTGREAA
jgi:hypothetical protein